MDTASHWLHSAWILNISGIMMRLVMQSVSNAHRIHCDNLQYAIAHQLRHRGWIVPAYTMAPNAETMKLMRVVVREDFSLSRCDQLYALFLTTSFGVVSNTDAMKLGSPTSRWLLKRSTTWTKRASTITWSKLTFHSSVFLDVVKNKNT